MKLSEFKYYLPQELIALHPTEERDEARMMVLNRKTKTIEHKLFKDIIAHIHSPPVLRREARPP